MKLSYGFYKLVYRPVRPTRTYFVIKISTRGDVKHGAQDEPYAPDFLPGEWCVIHPQLRRQRKPLRSVLLVDLYFPNSGKNEKIGFT